MDINTVCEARAAIRGTNSKHYWSYDLSYFTTWGRPHTGLLFINSRFVRLQARAVLCKQGRSTAQKDVVSRYKKTCACGFLCLGQNWM